MADNNFQGTGFSQQQWTALQNLIRQIPTQQGQQGQQGEQGEQGPTGPQGPSGTVSASGSNRWNPSDLGYFDLHLDKSFGEGEIVTVGKDTYFRNVLLFTDRIRNIAEVKGAAIVKANINTALRGTALI